MKKKSLILVIASMLAMSASSVFCEKMPIRAIRPGSEGSGFIVGNGGKLTGSLEMSNGSIRVDVNGTSDARVTGENVTIGYKTDKQEEMKVTGQYSFTDGIILGDGDKLMVNDGTVRMPILVQAGATARLIGAGSLGAPVTVGTSEGGATLIVDLTTVCDQPIVFAHEDSRLVLENNFTMGSQVVLSAGEGVASFTVDTNGYLLTLGDSRVAVQGALEGAWGNQDGPFAEADENLESWDGLRSIWLDTIRFESSRGPTRIELAGDLYLQGLWQFLGGGANISGQGYQLYTGFQSYDDPSTYCLEALDGCLVSLSNLKLRNQKSFAPDGQFLFSNVTLSSAALADQHFLTIDDNGDYVYPTEGNYKYLSTVMTVLEGGVNTVEAPNLYGLFRGARWISMMNKIVLHNSLWLPRAWVIEKEGSLEIDGNGHSLDFGVRGMIDFGRTYSALRIENTTLLNLKAGCLRDVWGRLYLSHVTLVDRNGRGALVVHGALDDGYAEMWSDIPSIEHFPVWGSITEEDYQALLEEYPDTAAGGDFFSRSIVFASGARLEFQDKIELSAQWRFGYDSRIDGGGNTIDVSAGGQIALVGGGFTSLTLSNVVVYGISGATSGGGSIMIDSDYKNIHCSNVTFVLADDFVIDSGRWYFDSTCTFITGDHKVTINAHPGFAGITYYDDGITVGPDATMTRVTVDGCTLWYDTLGFPESKNINPAIDTTITEVTDGRVRFTGRTPAVWGRIARVTGFDSGDIHFRATDKLSESLFLYQDTDDTNGVQLYFENEGDMTLDGNGRTIFFGDTRRYNDRGPWLVQFAGTGNVRFESVRLQDVQFTHFQFNPFLVPESEDEYTTPAVVFGDYTTLNLTDNDSLAFNLRIDTTSNAGGVIIDLGGKTLDLNSYSIVITPGSKLTLRNGTLSGVQGTQLALGQSASVQFENLALLLNGTTTIDNGRIAIVGKTSLGGTSGSVFINDSTDLCTPFEIKPDAVFALERGITYYHRCGETLQYTAENYMELYRNMYSFLIEDRGTLLLRGGTFQAPCWQFWVVHDEPTLDENGDQVFDEDEMPVTHQVQDTITVTDYDSDGNEIGSHTELLWQSVGLLLGGYSSGESMFTVESDSFLKGNIILVDQLSVDIHSGASLTIIEGELICGSSINMTI